MNTPAIHIFRPGRHTTMAGETITYTAADLAAAAHAYDPARHEAPLVLGHPATDDPAQGWVAGLTATPRGLFAAPRDLDPAFAESVKSRRYAKVSAKFYRPDSPNNPVPGVWYLRHVGFLGAQPPAVKGLDSPAFADDGDSDSVCFQAPVEFADAPAWPVARVFRRLREWLLTKYGQADADTALPDWCVEALETVVVRDEIKPAETAAPVAFSAPESSLDPQKEPSVTPEQKAALEADNARLKGELDALKKAQAAATARQRHDDNAAFAESLINEARLAPKHKAVLIAALNALSAPDTDGKTVAFADGDTVIPLDKALRGVFAAAEPVVAFGEVATKDRAVPSSPTNPLITNAEARTKGPRQ